MQKKMMAVAVAGALAAPGMAFAQASTVQIYGTIVENVLWVDQGGQRLNTDMMQTNDSAFGIRGEEALGGGLSAWFQCESTFTLNDGSATNTLCGKNSGVGFKGGWGTAFVGMWDAPMKIVIAPLRPFSTTGPFGSAGLLFGTSAANVANGVAGGNTQASAASFSRRQRNLISYWTPSWAGFEGKVAISNANEGTGQISGQTATKPRMWGVGLSYTNGPFYVAGGYEHHRNYDPGSASFALTAAGSGTVSTANSGRYTGGSDNGWNVGAAYTFAGVFKVSGIYARMKWDVNQGPTAATRLPSDAKVSSWGIFGDWNITGPHRVRGGYIDQGNVKGSAGLATTTGGLVGVGNYIANGGLGDTGSKLFELQYAYAFSKRTEVNFGYVKINNDRLGAQPLQTVGSVSIGEDQHAWVMGIRHNF